MKNKNPEKGNNPTEPFHNPADKTAIVIGATGLVGYQLVRLLLTDDSFGKVKVFTRRTLNLNSSKLEEHVVDFEKIDSWRDAVTGDVLFSALGTTRRKAGSKQAQFRIDHHYQHVCAKAAAENSVPVLVLVSSVGADPRSRLFYPRIKGLLESDVCELPFQHVVIIRPGPLYGSRPERRTGEAIGMLFVRMMNRFGILKRYRPIHGEEVARALIRSIGVLNRRKMVWSDLDLFELAGKSNAG